MSVTVTVRSNRIGELAAQLGSRSQAEVDRTAESIRGVANQLAPRDTGSLAEGLYVSNGTESDYSQRAGTAASRNPAAVIVPEVRPEFVISLGGPIPDGAYMSVVGASVAHGIFQEFGTRYLPARPFLLPALEGAANEFETGMSNIANL